MDALLSRLSALDSRHVLPLAATFAAGFACSELLRAYVYARPPFALAAALCSASPAGSAAGRGSITLAGGGPGSPELLTLAAYLALQEADVVISDLIAPPALRAVAPRHAEFHVADKVPGNADSAQSSVNGLGLAALRQGKRVVRLKVGDPYFYGRGGEEVQFYRAAGYEPRVIPGVSTALASPAAAGIPITHRGDANQVLLSTGQGRGGVFPDLPPHASNRTLVLLMAVGRIPRLRQDLCVERGYPEDTPVAIIERATHPDQRVTRTTLRDLAQDALAAVIESPATIVIGTVCTALSREGSAGGGSSGGGGGGDA
jgi:uroporphyrin-III C-methyltransferase